MSLRNKAIKLAYENPELRDAILPIVTAKEHATEDARRKYLQEHPKADPAKHTIRTKKPRKKKGPSEKDKEILKILDEHDKEQALLAEKAIAERVKAEQAKSDERAKARAERAKGKAPPHLEGLSKHLQDAVGKMPTKGMDKEEAYSHPKIKAMAKALMKLPRGTVARMYEQLQTRMLELGQPEKRGEPGRDDALNQIHAAWRATNDALFTMGDAHKEREKGEGMGKYLPRAELKKRRKVELDLDPLKDLQGHKKSDPVYKVLKEYRNDGKYVRLKTLEKAITHLDKMLDNPAHDGDEDKIEKAKKLLERINRGGPESRPSKKGSLRSGLIRLAHARPDLRDRLLPLLAKD